MVSDHDGDVPMPLSARRQMIAILFLTKPAPNAKPPRGPAPQRKTHPEGGERRGSLDKTNEKMRKKEYIRGL